MKNHRRAVYEILQCPDATARLVEYLRINPYATVAWEALGDRISHTGMRYGCYCRALAGGEYFDNEDRFVRVKLASMMHEQGVDDAARHELQLVAEIYNSGLYTVPDDFFALMQQSWVPGETTADNTWHYKDGSVALEERFFAAIPSVPVLVTAVDKRLDIVRCLDPGRQSIEFNMARTGFIPAVNNVLRVRLTDNEVLTCQPGNDEDSLLFFKLYDGILNICGMCGRVDDVFVPAELLIESEITSDCHVTGVAMAVAPTTHDDLLWRARTIRISIANS